MAKISVKSVVGRLKPPTVTTKIMQVTGLANKWERGMSFSGEYIGLIGHFQAINCATGAKFIGEECVLPWEALQMILPVFKEALSGVEFMFDISIKPSESLYGYDYLCDAVVPAGHNNSLDAIRKKAPGPKKGGT